MTRKILSFIIMAVAALTASAQGSLIRPVGYSVTEDINISGAMFGTAGTYSIGALLDPSDLAEYKGCRILGMKVAVGTDLGRTRMFLYDVSGDAPEIVHEQNQRLYEGWNEILFSGNGYTITGEEEYFFGYDYVETQEMIDARQGGIATVGYDVAGSFLLLRDNALYTVSNAGMLCVQLLVDVTNLPADKFNYTFFDPGFRYKKANEAFEMMATLRNNGREGVNTVTLAYCFDDMEPVYETVEKEVPSGGSFTWELKTQLPAELGLGSHTFTLWVDQLDGHAPESECTRTARFGIYSDEMKRQQMFVEVYAHADRAQSAQFDKVVETMKGDLRSKVAVVKLLNSGSNVCPDEAAAFTDLYAYTFPSFTVNRSYFPCEYHVAYDMNDYLDVFPMEMLSAILDDTVELDNSSVSLGSIYLGGDYNETSRELTVNVTGSLLPEATAIHGPMTVTVMLVEDGVVAPQVVRNALGRETTDRNYVHNSVLRSYVTSSRGDLVNVDGDKYSATFRTVLDGTWNPDKMRVVAILAPSAENLSAENLTEYDVTNCTSSPINGIAAISDVVADRDTEDGPAEYFTLDGRHVQEPLAPGFYIKRTANGRSSKVYVK